MKIELSRRFWWIATGIVVLFTLVFVGQNLLHVLSLKRDITKLEDEEEAYLEEYAREQFGMRRSTEEVFIIK